MVTTQENDISIAEMFQEIMLQCVEVTVRDVTVSNNEEIEVK